MDGGRIMVDDIEFFPPEQEGEFIREFSEGCKECEATTEFHSCPYQIELFGNDNPICTCCAHCERECGRDV